MATKTNPNASEAQYSPIEANQQIRSLPGVSYPHVSPQELSDYLDDNYDAVLTTGLARNPKYRKPTLGIILDGDASSDDISKLLLYISRSPRMQNFHVIDSTRDPLSIAVEYDAPFLGVAEIEVVQDVLDKTDGVAETSIEMLDGQPVINVGLASMSDAVGRMHRLFDKTLFRWDFVLPGTVRVEHVVDPE